MYLKPNRRFKDGKEHTYWSIVESKRCLQGKTVQRLVFYLGEINDSQKESWCKTISVFDEAEDVSTEMALFPSTRSVPEHVVQGLQLRMAEFSIQRPRQWGACWMATLLWDQLKLDDFWSPHLPPSREGTPWKKVLQTLVTYRLIEPGSEWYLHRHWYQQSAMGDLLNEDFALVEKDTLYRCLDKALPHKESFFNFLRQRWDDLFKIKFDVLLYDLTSTYFESDPPFPEKDKRAFGYSRDKRSDCVQVVIALIVTPEGFPLAYEVMPGNTSDKTTLRTFLARIEKQYGKAERLWVMDRGIPSEEVLEEMRKNDPRTCYLVGTPRGKLTKLEAEFSKRPWEKAREGVSVKLLPKEGELYVLAHSHARSNKERAMRQRKLKAYWARLKELQKMKKLKRDDLLLKLGAAQKQAGNAKKLVAVKLPGADQEVDEQTFTFKLLKKKLRAIRKTEGKYLLRSNLTESEPGRLWEIYMQLCEIEAAFKNLKSDLEIRPVYHQLEHRIEAHIFVAFMAYCLQITLRHKLRALAPGLTSRAVLDKLACIQMMDVIFPTVDGRKLVLTRYTQPEKDQLMVLDQLKLQLPEQPPPRISGDKKLILKNKM
jgi:transposase